MNPEPVLSILPEGIVYAVLLLLFPIVHPFKSTVTPELLRIVTDSELVGLATTL